MALPININDLVHGNSVEWERLEFKQGWNPEDVVHSMCAFANDINNWGGGYIIIGIAENDGLPIFPPVGLQANQMDAIQGNIVNLANQLQPNYFPIIQPYILEEKHILVLWCPAGDHRPYTSPVSLGTSSQRQSYIRSGSKTIIARGVNLIRLQELAARIPFDDRVNNHATINDFDLGLIQSYLQEIKSELYNESTKMPLIDIAKSMYIAKGPLEDTRPVNIGLLFFSKNPETFFPRSWIELVWHKDTSGRNFKEHYFKGPIHLQLRNALSFIENNILNEEVIKQANKAEALRFYNFPYEAVEEALSNAIYHKNYELGSPIEVQIWPDKIEILSYPGPVPPVNAEILKSQRRIVAREYRNRRIGDFLKELHLTEGRGTGFPTIYDTMAENGSPAPLFETDELNYVLVTLPIHPLSGKGTRVSDQASNQAGNQVKNNIFNNLDEIISFCNQASNQVSNQASNQASDQARQLVKELVHERVVEMLLILNEWQNKADLFNQLNISNQTKNRKKYLDPLIEYGWATMEFPENKTSPNQRYRITNTGAQLLNLIHLK